MTSESARQAALDALTAEISAFDWANMTDGRRRVLEAFLRIATTDGYAGVTMRALGRQVNIKAPSLYSHFPGGRDEVVSAALRWHYSRFAEAVVDALNETSTAREFWEALVNHHVRRQLEMLENDMFDLMLATDRISGFLPDATRTEITHLVGLDKALFVGAARDMGYSGEVDGAVAMVLTLLDGVRSWSGWDGSPTKLGSIADAAVAVSLATLNARAVAPAEIS
jgi:AcrR family transcriptional regulator